MSERPSTLALSPLVVALAASSLAGCRGCDKDRHPFVPYTLEGAEGAPSSPSSSGRRASASPPPSGSGVAGGSFPRVVAVAAPPGATSWSLGGMPLSAASGRIFIAGLALAQPPGQPPSVAAFVGDGGSMAGEVILYRAEPGGGSASSQATLARLPAWMGASGAGCNHVVALSQIGPSMLWADVTLRCEKRESDAPARWLAAISTSNPSPLRFELRAAAPAEGDRAIFEADAADRDGDGTDDLLLQIALDGNAAQGAGRAVAPLRFLDRPSGMARDTGEPEHTLRESASELMKQAPRKATAPETRANALYARRLYAYLCAEGGAPGVAFGDSTPIRCGASGLLGDLLYAEARSALALGDLPRAFAMQARIARDVPKSHRAADLDKALASSTSAVTAKALQLRTPVAPWSVALPLAFDASGKLLVLSPSGVVIVDPKTGEEEPGPTPAPPSWTPAAELVGDLRLSRVSDPCQATALQLHVVSSSSSTRAVGTPVSGGSAPNCASADSLPLWLLDRNAEGLVVLAQGEAVALSPDGERTKPAPWPSSPGGRGTIRSPDGAYTALAAGERVLVRGGSAKPQLWRPEPRFSLSGCTVANGGSAVACVLDKGAVLLTP